MRSGGQLLQDGTDRDIEHPDLENIETYEVYGINEAAKALGKAPLTLRRWIGQEVVPAPIARDTVHHGMQYTRGELQVIANELAIHEQEFEYLSRKHETTIHRIWQNMQAYREHSI